MSRPADLKWGELTSGKSNACPENKRHGDLRIVRNESGGLLAICHKCYEPRRGSIDLRDQMRVEVR
mgnify:FL=1